MKHDNIENCPEYPCDEDVEDLKEEDSERRKEEHRRAMERNWGPACERDA